METIKGLSERFLKFFEEGKKTGQYKTAAEFCKIIGVSPQMLNEVVKGRSNVGIQLIQNTLLKFPKLNPHWIFGGKGEMFLDDAAAFDAEMRAIDKQIIEDYKKKEDEFNNKMLFLIGQLQEEVGIANRLRQQLIKLGAKPIE